MIYVYAIDDEEEVQMQIGSYKNGESFDIYPSLFGYGTRIEVRAVEDEPKAAPVKRVHRKKAVGMKNPPEEAPNV